jgi:tetratricopeptide (TPR) repeat protein
MGNSSKTPAKDCQSILTNASRLAHIGRFQEAELLADKLLAMEADNTDALVLKAMLIGQKNKLSQSEKLIRRALKLKPGSPDYHCNLALILGKANKHQEAIKEYLIAISLNPKLSQAYYNLGILYRASKSYRKAVDAFRNAISLKNDYAQAYNALGNTYRDIDDTKNAILSFKTALSYNPNLVNAQAQLGFLLYTQDFIDEAELHLQKAVKLDPKYPRLLYILGCILLEQSKTPKAIELLSNAILTDETPDSYIQLGHALRKLGVYEKAIETYLSALNRFPENVDLLFGLGLTMQASRKQHAAADYFRKVLVIDAENTKALTSLATSLTLMGKTDDAIKYCRKALTIDKDNINAASIMSRIHAYSGNTVDAYKYIKPHLRAGTRDANLALAFANLSKKLARQQEAVSLLEELIVSDNQLSLNLYRTILFTLGRLHDDIGNYDLAFEYYKKANSRADEKHDYVEHTKIIKTLIDFHKNAYMENRPMSRQNSELPVFIVGMPRSGTSLVEQILSSHSQVYGAGELLDITNMAENLQNILNSPTPYPFCMEYLTTPILDRLANKHLKKLSGYDPFALRVTDKLPGNYLHLGFIEQLFPSALIIHCKRNPIDTCLSCYFTDFTGSHPYSYNLEDLAHYYNDYDKLMQHWKSLLKLPILDIYYEDLVLNFESTAKRLLASCGLQWESGCMNFYNSRRFVHTASFDQVSQNIYNRSVNRWKNYQQYLRPLIDILHDSNE